MQVLIVTDSFKESLDAKQVAQAIADGVTSIDPNIKPHCIPFSDGGEGALGVLENHAEGVIEECPTVDALGRPKSAYYFRFNKGQKAIHYSSNFKLLVSDNLLFSTPLGLSSSNTIRLRNNEVF